MEGFQLFILLMAAAILVVAFAQKVNIPYPIALVLGGAAMGFIPGLEWVTFNPNAILIIVLPPILYYGAFWTSFREFKRQWRDIFSLSLGLVFATTLVIGVMFKWFFPDYSWAMAFAFGAIVSPPDATAATTILKRFAINSRLLNVLEGESLVNDAAALVLYKIAVTALWTGVFSWSEATVEFVRSVGGGILVGVVGGGAIQYFSGRFLTPIVGVMFSFTIPYLTYILADYLGVSGVLAVVANGLILSRLFILRFPSLRRILAVTPWDIFIILLNCFVFILIGIELRSISARLTAYQMVLYAGYGILITCAIVIVRMIWVYAKHAVSYFKARYDPKQCEECNQILREAAILGWSGMRGIVSLAAVLGLPYVHTDGTPIIGRDVTIYLTFIVIFLTLIVPGLTLPMLLKWLKIHHHISPAKVQTNRKKLLEAAKNEIVAYTYLSDEERNFLINYFSTRHRILGIAASTEEQLHNLELARRKVIEVQRQMLLQLWEQGEMDDKLLKLLELELDLEESLYVRAEIK